MELKDTARRSWQAVQDADELKGLLSDTSRTLDEDEVVHTVRPRTRTLPWSMLVTAGTVFALVVVALLYGDSLLDAIAGNTPSDSDSKPASAFDATEIRTNGTHSFRKTAIIVSIDGLRQVIVACQSSFAKRSKSERTI